MNGAPAPRFGAPADGYTLLFGNSSLPISVTLYDKLPFDVLKDFTPISLVALTPSVLVVHPSLPVKSVKELIALAKKQPGKLNFASGGVGNTMHLAAALLNTMAGIRMVHVPYKGAGPAIVDVLAGQCDMVFVNIAPVLGHIRAGKVVAIAVRTPEMRERYVSVGSEPETSTPEQFAAYLKTDFGNWAKVVKASGAKAE